MSEVKEVMTVREAFAEQAAKNADSHLSDRERTARIEVLARSMQYLLLEAVDASFRSSVKNMCDEEGFDLVPLKCLSRRHSQLQDLIAITGSQLKETAAIVVDHIQSHVPTRENYGLYLFDAFKRASAALQFADVSSLLSAEDIENRWKQLIDSRMTDDEEDEDSE